MVKVSSWPSRHLKVFRLLLPCFSSILSLLTSWPLERSVLGTGVTRFPESLWNKLVYLAVSVLWDGEEWGHCPLIRCHELRDPSEFQPDQQGQGSRAFCILQCARKEECMSYFGPHVNNNIVWNLLTFFTFQPSGCIDLKNSQVLLCVAPFSLRRNGMHLLRLAVSLTLLTFSIDWLPTVVIISTLKILSSSLGPLTGVGGDVLSGN